VNDPVDRAAALAANVDLLEEQHAQLQALVSALDADGWLTPIPGWQWDVRDTVAHLADTDAIAIDTMTDGPRSLNRTAVNALSSDDVILAGVRRGRRLSGPTVGQRWIEVSARERARLRACDPADKVPWGLGMRATTFSVARLMETWAHGLDLRAALGNDEVASPATLRMIAAMSFRALPYAFRHAGVVAGPPAVDVELAAADGSVLTLGTPDAPDRIHGDLEQFCRIFVQRLQPADAHQLVATGDGAVAVLAHARAYL
jgi:uncharacterized protein (TIGR03084 family)